MVVSITEDFLKRGHNELIREFVTKMNRVGEDAVYEVNMGDYLVEYLVPGVKLNMNHLKIQEIGNLITTAQKEVDMQAECGCIMGAIGPVDKIELVFDYTFDFGEEPIEGSASVTMYDFMARYTVTPEVIDKVEDFIYSHEQGMLHLKVNDFNFSAVDFPIRVYGEKKDEVHSALEALFSRFLSSKEPLDKTQLSLLE